MVISEDQFYRLTIHIDDISLVRLDFSTQLHVHEA